MTGPDKEIDKALGLMQEARKLLFQALHEKGEISQNLTKGVDKLAMAFEFVESPEDPVLMCPECGCLFYKTLQSGRYQCLSCDEKWTEQQERRS